MRNLAKRAVAEGYNSLRWESAEVEAIKFYDRLGARDTGKTSYTVDGADLPQFATA